MKRIVCFGEFLLRLSPQLGGTWIREGVMPVFIGGAELNAATALAAWGLPASYCTALPDHYLSHEVAAAIAGRGIDTSHIQYRGNRIGTYYLPQGGDMKSAGVIYDRAHSAFWELAPGSIDWDRVLDGAGWFHFSAISPALNASVAEVCREGAAAAATKGLTVSVDLNYRAKLWQCGKDPRDVMPGLVQHCNLVMGNIWAAEKMLGLTLPAGLSNKKPELLEQSAQTAAKIFRDYPSCSTVAHTFRFDAGEGIRYYAALHNGEGNFTSREMQTEKVVDRVGSGDTFMAGLIYGLGNGLPAQETIDFAAAAAFQKLFIKGDALTITVEDIRKGYLQYA